MIIKVGNNEYWNTRSDPNNPTADGQGIDAAGAEWNICISARSIGKSYAGKMNAIDNFIASGKGVAIIKRYQDDIKTDFMTSYWSDMYDYFYEKAHVIWRDFETFGIIPWRGDWNVYGFKDNEKTLLGCLGHAFAINLSGRYKSQTYPDINLVIVEEFIPEDHKVLPNEFDKLLSIISTIRRQKENFKIYLWANALDPNCDFFHEMKIDPNVLKQGEIKVFEYHNGDNGELKNKVAVEWVRPLNQSPESQAWMMFNRPTEQMMYRGTWQTQSYRKFEEEVFDRTKPDLSLVIDYKFIHLYCYVFQSDDNYYMIVSKTRKTNKVIYLTLHEGQTNLRRKMFNLRSGLEGVRRLKAFLAELYNNDLIYYENDLCGVDFERVYEAFT